MAFLDLLLNSILIDSEFANNKIALFNASRSPNLTNIPLDPTTSGIPPISKETTTQPCCIASRATMPKDSKLDGKTTIDAEFKSKCL